MFFALDRPSLFLLVLVLSSASSPIQASSPTSTTSSPTTSLSLSLILLLLLMLLLLLLELRRRTRTLDSTESASRLLAVILALDGAALFPSEDSLPFDIIGLQVLDVVGLTDGLDQHAHLVWELGNKNHGLEVRRDGAFGCCHPSKTDKDGVEPGINVGLILGGLRGIRDCFGLGSPFA